MLYKRLILNSIKKWLYREEIIILTGPRQSGKTSLMRIIFNELKGKEECFFVSLEDFSVLDLLNRTPENIFKIIPKLEKRIFVFIDEVQYLKNPSNFLKYLFDFYKERVKLIVSGSSAFYLDKRFKDSLAGRKKIFYVFPLNFFDFLIFKNKEELIDKVKPIFSFRIDLEKKLLYNEKKAIAELLNEYATFGSYPKVALEKDFSIKKELLKELVNSYVKKDILESEISSPEKYFNLLKILSYRVGNLLNKKELSGLIGVSSTAISNYLYVMEKSFHLKLVLPFFKNPKKEITKMPKVYFFDLGLRNSLLNNFTPLENREDRGQVFENIVFRLMIDNFGMDEVKFWRKQSGTEIDFVIASQKKAFEVKYRKELIKKKQTASFKESYPDFSLYALYMDEENLPEISKL